MKNALYFGVAFLFVGLGIAALSAPERATIFTAEGGFCWAPYNPWRISYAGQTAQTTVVTNQYGGVINTGYRYVLTNEVFNTVRYFVDFDIKPTDTNHADRLPAVRWSITPNSDGQTISEDGFVDIHDSTNRNYTIKAIAPDYTYQTYSSTINLTYRYASTNLNYVADIPGSLRDRMNNEALEVLTNAVFVKWEVAYKSEGGSSTTNKVWQTFICPMSFTRAPSYSRAYGNVHLWPASKHVLISANHYGTLKWTGNYTMNDGVTTNTVKKLPWVSLRDWALENGFTTNDINKVKSISDICVVPCDLSSEVPDGCIPYFMSPEQLDTYFGGDIIGLPCWENVQDYNWAVPCVVDANNGNWGTNTLNARLDVAAAMDALNPRYYIYGGDSGKCVFIMIKGKPVPIAAQYSIARAGPDYIAVFPILKAYVESYGDELKVLTDEDFEP